MSHLNCRQLMSFYFFFSTHTGRKATKSKRNKCETSVSSSRVHRIKQKSCERLPYVGMLALLLCLRQKKHLQLVIAMIFIKLVIAKGKRHVGVNDRRLERFSQMVKTRVIRLRVRGKRERELEKNTQGVHPRVFRG